MRMAIRPEDENSCIVLALASTSIISRCRWEVLGSYDIDNFYILLHMCTERRIQEIQGRSEVVQLCQLRTECCKQDKVRKMHNP